MRIEIDEQRTSAKRDYSHDYASLLILIMLIGVIFIGGLVR
jgi:hypothetical protein